MKGRAFGAGVVALLMLASAGAHGFLGWPVIGGALAQTTAAPDLVSGLAVGWWFGSASMAGFAAVVLHVAWRLLRGRDVSLVPLAIVGVTYLAFGAVAIGYHGVSAPMMSFVVLGAALIGLSARRA